MASQLCDLVSIVSVSFWGYNTQRWPVMKISGKGAKFTRFPMSLTYFFWVADIHFNLKQQKGCWHYSSGALVPHLRCQLKNMTACGCVITSPLLGDLHITSSHHVCGRRGISSNVAHVALRHNPLSESQNVLECHSQGFLSLTDLFAQRHMWMCAYLQMEDMGNCF